MGETWDLSRTTKSDDEHNKKIYITVDRIVMGMMGTMG